MRSNVIKFIALLITATVVLISCTAGAESVGKLAVPGVAEIATEPVLSGARKIVSSADLPVPMTLNDAIERGHVERLREEETDLFSAIFLNEDGSKTMYMFASPIKYVSASGEVKDKSTKFASDRKGYYIRDNDVNLTFGTRSADAVLLQHGKHIVKIEQTALRKADQEARLVENALVFEDAFERGAVLEYIPLLSGVESRMVVESPDKLSHFTYSITAEDLKLSKDENGSYSFCDKDGKSVFCIGGATIEGANGRHCEILPEISHTSDFVYSVTIPLDEDVISQNGISYPLIASTSSTITINSSIEDSVVYEGYPNSAFGSYLFNSIGYLDASHKVGRLLVKTPGLFTNSTFNSIAYNSIRKAELHIYTASGGTRVSLMPCRSAKSWSEYSITWNSLFNSTQFSKWMRLENPKFDAAASDKYIYLPYAPSSGGSAVAVNITGTVKAWKESSAYRGNGILLYNNESESSSSKCRDFCSKEYANSHSGSLMPYLTINYNSSSYIPVKLYIHYDPAFALKCAEEYGNFPNPVNMKLTAILNGGFSKLQTRFGIAMSFEQTAYSSYIYSGLCLQRNNLNNICTCSDTCKNGGTYHHTNQRNMMHTSRFSDMNLSTGIKMLVTGHKTCEEKGNTETCNGNGALGLAYSWHAGLPGGTARIGVFATDNSSTTNNYKAYVVFHEIGHVFGVPDHYDSNGQTVPDMDGRVHKCIWGNLRHTYEVYNDLKMCEYCKNLWNNHLYAY